MDIFKEAKKFGKRVTLNTNKFKGRLAEDSYAFSARASGKEVKRTGRGSDFKERRVDFITGKRGPWKHVEVKSGGAKLSKLQKKTKNKHGGNYKVVRSDWF